MNLDSLLASFKDTLTPSNFDKFVGVLTTEVTARLEKVIFKTTFNKVKKPSNLKFIFSTILF